MINLHGAGTALITPFKEDLSIDFDALSKLIEHLIDNKIDYLVALGTTGEVATLDAEEKQQIITHVVSQVNNRVPIVVGMGGNNTQAIIKDMNSFDIKGVSAILSVSPYYNKPNQKGIINHYRLLSEASPLPIIIYNVPGRTGSNMTAKTQLEIALFSNVIATKEASGNMEQIMEIIANKPKGFEVISGDDALTYPMMCCGAAGVISVVNHAIPAQFNQMVHLCNQGKYAEARTIHYKSLPLCNAIFEDGSPGGIKEILNEMGIGQTYMRPPLYPVNKDLAARLRATVN